MGRHPKPVTLSTVPWPHPVCLLFTTTDIVPVRGSQVNRRLSDRQQLAERAEVLVEPEFHSSAAVGTGTMCSSDHRGVGERRTNFLRPLPDTPLAQIRRAAYAWRKPSLCRGRIAA